MKLPAVCGLPALLAVALSGCDPKSSSAAKTTIAPLSLGEERIEDLEILEHDFGRVRAGQKLDVALPFTNTRSKTLKLSARGSCTCQGFTFEHDVLPAGQSTLLNVAINTSNQGGIVRLSVEVLATNEVIQRYEIVGEIIPAPAIVTHPRILELGTLALGQEVQHKIDIEILETGAEASTYEVVRKPNNQGSIVNYEWTLDEEPFLVKRDESHGRVRYFYRATLVVRAVTSGTINVMIPIVFRNNRYDSVVGSHLPVFGQVRGPLKISPEEVFLGSISAGAETIHAFEVVSGAKIEGMPTIETEDDTLNLRRIEPLEQGYRLIIGVRPPVGNSLLDEVMTVRWGSYRSKPISIVGRVR